MSLMEADRVAGRPQQPAAHLLVGERVDPAQVQAAVPVPGDNRPVLHDRQAARLAVRTQQVLAHETDLTATVDPFAGSYAVEAMTDAVEAEAGALMAKV